MRSVLITGASGGIGRAAARLFARHGYAVAVHYHRSRETAETLVQELRAAGANAILVGADVSDDRDVAEMVRQTEAAFGEISVFIHNAGTASQKLLTDLSPEEWHSLMGVHLDGAYYGCRHIIPGMVRRKQGKILFVSSMWGVTGASCEAAYSAAKAGLIGLTKALAKELGPSYIQVNCVAPGVIDTAMCAGLDEGTRRSLADETPLGRLGTPEDVAAALYFLASDEADFITGQVLGVDGGFAV